MIDESGILMGQVAVHLPPDMRGQQIIQRRDLSAATQSNVTFNHLACWLNIESMMWMKASIAIEQPMTAGEDSPPANLTTLVLAGAWNPARDHPRREQTRRYPGARSIVVRSPRRPRSAD
jgi:hypothetical protein